MDDSGRSIGAPSDSLFRVGAVLVAVGTVATIIALLPLLLDRGAFPVVVYLLCFLAPVGLGLILVALWQRARTRSSRLESPPSDHSA